jgi:hypothetical protein
MALTKSTPKTSRMTSAQSEHATNAAHETMRGTGGRGIDEAFPLTVTYCRPPSSRSFPR